MLLCTTMMYLAPVGKRDGGLRRKSVREGYWGAPTGDFDWCEENYPYSEGIMGYIAEPWNTFSNLAWPPLSLAIGARLHWLNMLDAQAVAGLTLAALIGTGSFLFHATLLYEAQLLDELPMINFALLSAWLSYSRRQGQGIEGRDGQAGSLACAAFGLSFVPWLFLTGRESAYHAIGRAVMSVLFTICFVSLGYSSTKMVEELKQVLSEGDGRSLELLHTGMFVLCVCAIVAWITDSVHCEVWQNLPFGIPYPQLHATLWHNLMLLVVIGLILLQVQHRQVFHVCGGSRAALEKRPQRARVIQSVLPIFS